ncbi:GDSL esterase/lipase At5g55050-like isoform X2 [Oryza brachyantha]|uniref:GDSL esterase/lipase At5g55050-like isoform X2 n=1 Tax=Oryza brachyantha TaxID=4533 RepID=UPI0003EA91F7|nr:GDSL esterase/lipase At5g55050-like isoform X2 [Oryza brachyantha]
MCLPISWHPLNLYIFHRLIQAAKLAMSMNNMKSNSSTGVGRLMTMMIFITVHLLLQQQYCLGGAQQLVQVPAVFVLGDSTLDVGNNNYLPGKDVFRANKPYNGIDYPASIPTGRFSNGYNLADYLAMKLGFKESPPAYLSLLQGPGPLPNLTLAINALSRGVNFASGGAGVLDSTYAGRCIPLSTQVRSMEATRAAMVAKVGSPAAVSAHIARSFFLLGVANNDMFVFATAQQQRNRSATPAEVAAFYTDLVGKYSDAIMELYGMGARKFGVINVGLVGCVPLVRAMSPTGACSDDLNRLAAGFDDALASLLSGLAARLPAFSYSLADAQAIARLAFADPMASGYTNVDEACCGSGRLRAEADCQVGSMLCSDRDKWAFWDRVHPSQRACFLSAAAYYDGPAQLTKPINFKHLAST